MSREKNPLVSVIVPVYNVEKYLQECVESISAQTYKNLEILLIDDGSPDSSGKICDALAKGDSRIKVVHKKNEGLNFARKTGFEHSAGEYVTFVDSDDLIRNDAIKVMLSAVYKDNIVCAIGGYQKFTKSEALNTIQDKANHEQSAVLDKESLIHGLLLGVDYKNILMMTAWGKLFHRSILDAVDWNASNYRANEDEFMALQYYPLLEKAVIIPSNIYFYRENPNSITMTEYKNSFKGTPLNKFDTIERIYQEGIVRLGNEYQADILAKFVYGFIIAINEQVASDDAAVRIKDVINDYFVSKRDILTAEVFDRIDPLTRVQSQGLIEGGVVGCFREKATFLSDEKEEVIDYAHGLEEVIADREKKILDLQAQFLRNRIKRFLGQD